MNPLGVVTQFKYSVGKADSMKNNHTEMHLQNVNILNGSAEYHKYYKNGVCCNENLNFNQMSSVLG